MEEEPNVLIPIHSIGPAPDIKHIPQLTLSQYMSQFSKLLYVQINQGLTVCGIPRHKPDLPDVIGTYGLSGCISVIFQTPDCCFVSHISSHSVNNMDNTIIQTILDNSLAKFNNDAQTTITWTNFNNNDCRLFVVESRLKAGGGGAYPGRLYIDAVETLLNNGVTTISSIYSSNIFINLWSKWVMES